MWNPWSNLAGPGIVFPQNISQTREVTLSPQKREFKETWQSSFNSPRSSFNSLQNAFNSPRNSFNSPRKTTVKRAVQSSESSPRSTLKMDVYFENINGDICLTKVKTEKHVRWKLLKNKYWPLHFHSAVMSKKTVENGIYNMKNHKTLRITLTKREAQPYMNGKYIEIPKKPKPQAKKKATPSKIVNIRYETNNYYNAGPSTSNWDRIEYDYENSEDESEDSEYSSCVYNESRCTNNVYYD